MSDMPHLDDRPWAVDVHAHFFIAGQGPNMAWSPEAAMMFMDAHRIQLQLLSFPMPGPAEAVRRFNDYAASLVASHPSRFGMLASIPMSDQDPRAALAEIDRAADELHADGFALVTNCGGKYLGDPSFEAVFAALNQRHATAFIHPVNPPGFDLVSCGRPGPLIELPMETARSAVDLIWAGVLSRHPDVNLILAHAAGVLPVLAPRILDVGPLDFVPDPAEGTSFDDVRKQLSRLYVTDPSHIVFGTDYPATVPGGIADANLAALNETRLLTDEEISAIGTNAIRVFPSLRERISVS
jgi:6-methylsalicylate decarboxylase